MIKSIRAIRKNHRLSTSSEESSSQSGDEALDDIGNHHSQEKLDSIGKMDETMSVATSIEHFSVERLNSQEESDNRWFQETFQLQNISPLDLSRQQIESRKSIIERAHQILTTQESLSNSENEPRDSRKNHITNTSNENVVRELENVSNAEVSDDGSESTVHGDDHKSDDRCESGSIDHENESEVPTVIGSGKTESLINSVAERDNEWFRETFQLEGASPTGVSNKFTLMRTTFVEHAKGVLEIRNFDGETNGNNMPQDSNIDAQSKTDDSHRSNKPENDGVTPQEKNSDTKSSPLKQMSICQQQTLFSRKNRQQQAILRN